MPQTFSRLAVCLMRDITHYRHANDNDSSNEPYDIPGYNGVERAFGASNGDNVRRLRVAVDGGGPCQWQLNWLRIADNVPLAKGKEVIDTSNIIDFGDYDLSDGHGTGSGQSTLRGETGAENRLFPYDIH